MMEMTIISIMVEGGVDEKQLSSLRKVTIKLVPKKKVGNAGNSVPRQIIFHRIKCQKFV